MADVLVARFQFIGTNPFGEFLAGDRLEFYYDNATPQPQGFTDGISVYKYSPGDAGFTPDTLDALSAWLDTGSDWNFSGGFQQVGLTNTDQSSYLYTDYTFETSRLYSFDYEFTTDEAYNTAQIHIEITDGSGTNLSTKKIIDVTNAGTFSGNYSFYAPAGATRIRIYCIQTASGMLNPVNTYIINEFSNQTASEGATPEGYNEITSGANIQSFGNSSYLTTEYTAAAGVCNGTTNYSFAHSQLSFPYLWGTGFADFPGCAVNPPACNLQVSGLPDVENATGEAIADGSITVVGASSQTIQYRLNSDFVYDDGTGQSTGLFENLLPGNYRVYLRDANNCFANVAVTVGFSEDYGVLNTLEFDSLAGHVAKIEIVEFDYSGVETEVIGADVAFNRMLRGEGSENKFESVLATEAVLGLTSITDFQFQSLFTNNPEQYRLYYYRDDVLKGVYKVLPQQYEEDFKAPPYYVKVRATDGLPSLKNFPFIQDDGQRFNGSIKAIEVLAFILKKIKLHINIRVAINLYATGMTTTAASDPLDQAYVDTDAYYLNESNPDCDYVLRQIIEPFGARILQENAVWNILRVEELITDYDYREFDEHGAYVSNSNYDPIVDIINPSTSQTGTFLSDRNHYLKTCPGYGKIRMFYKLGLRENILENGDFRLISRFVPGFGYVLEMDTFGWQLVQNGSQVNSSFEYIDGGENVAWKIVGDWNVTADTGEAYIQSDSYTVKMGLANQLKFKFRYKIPAPVVGTVNISGNYIVEQIPIPYQKVRIRVKYGDYYLTADGGWSESENIITIFTSEYDKFLETEIIARQPYTVIGTTPTPDTDAANGFVLDVRVYHSYIYHAEFTSLVVLKSKDTYDSGNSVLPTGSRTQVYTGTYMYYYELEENTDAENSPAIIRPNDYHATNNPRQWILKIRVAPVILTGSFTTPFWVDKVTCEFLTNGDRSADTIIRELPAESKNIAVLEKEITHGSYQSLITTIPSFGLTNAFSGGFSLALTTTNVLSADILYAGYFRASNGDGYETWTRDGISEETTLHAILLQQYAVQYKRSWRKLTGSLYSPNRAFTFLDVFSMASESNRKYLPVSGSIDELNNRFQGEFLELMDVAEGAGSDGGGSAPFSSAFSTAFGSSYD
jgi:hypothetical protein